MVRAHVCREQDELLRELQAQLDAVHRDGAAGHALERHQQDSTLQLEVHVSPIMLLRLQPPWVQQACVSSNLAFIFACTQHHLCANSRLHK